MGPLSARLKSCPDAYRSLKAILQVAQQTLVSLQIRRAAPRREDELVHALACPWSGFQLNQLLDTQRGWFALIAKGDDRADRVIFGDFKSRASGGLVKAGHRVRPQAERRGLQGESACGSAQVIERVCVRSAIMAELGARHAQNQHRSRPGPAL